jgi:hypothetical protein
MRPAARPGRLLAVRRGCRPPPARVVPAFAPHSRSEGADLARQRGFARGARLPEAARLGGTRPQALDEDVGAVGQAQQHVEAAAQVERDRPLAGVHGEEHRALAVPERRAPGARFVADGRRLDLDHVRSERREDLRAVRAGERRRHVDHTYTRQR